MKTLSYTIVLEPAEEGGFNVWVPALPGCVTQGSNHQEAVAMARDAISLWLQTLAETDEPIPEEPVPYPVEIAQVHVKILLSEGDTR